MILILRVPTLFLFSVASLHVFFVHCWDSQQPNFHVQEVQVWDNSQRRPGTPKGCELPSFLVAKWNVIQYTLQEINISHLGKRKIIFKMDFSGDMLVPRRVSVGIFDELLKNVVLSLILWGIGHNNKWNCDRDTFIFVSKMHTHKIQGQAMEQKMNLKFSDVVHFARSILYSSIISCKMFIQH